MKTHRGFTLIETLIVMAVIAILAALGTLGVDEYVTSAKATKIIMNLHTMKKALWEWYVDNRDKVQSDGRVKIGNNTKPIQEHQIDKDGLDLRKYLKRLDASGIKFNPTDDEKFTDANNNTVSRQRTDLSEGCYGVCDYGTTIHENGSKTTDRNKWYVGYHFKTGEEAVREKVRGRMKVAGGLLFGTADAHPVPTNYSGDEAKSREVAVWLQVR